MAKNTKKRAIIYSNVKENKKIAEEKQRMKESQINLNDEVIIGFNSNKSNNNKGSVVSKKSTPKSDVKRNKKKTQKGSKNNIQKNMPKKVQKDVKKNAPPKEPKKVQKNTKPRTSDIDINIQNNDNGKTVKKVKKNKKLNPQVKKRVSIIFKIFVVLMILIAGVIFLIKAPMFNIREVQVKIENSNILTENEIKESSKIDIGENIFTISKTMATEGIKKNTYVDSVKIKRGLPDKVIIEVTERKIKFQLKKNGAEGIYVYVDAKGTVVDEKTEKKDCVCVVGYSTSELKLGEQLNEEDLKKLSAVMQIQQEAENYGIKDQITQIDISNSYDYLIYFDNAGKVAHLGDTTLMNDKMARIKKILDMESEYEGVIYVNVNLNNGEYPYFRENV